MTLNDLTQGLNQAELAITTRPFCGNIRDETYDLIVDQQEDVIIRRPTPQTRPGLLKPYRSYIALMQVSKQI